ncbi:hypothetical protein [Nonomuraea recticatena]|uniref:Uncharacterized protein n=1 Tax=Nonomuraea recticatena TaxID=46178 RepID=A0ABN3TDW7_9ACTN
MPYRHPYPPSDLQEAHHRHRTASHLLAIFARTTPGLDDLWSLLSAALADIPTLATEITALRAALAATRAQRANLVAAARATLAAHHEGEHDPLYYLRDELTAQLATDQRAGEPQ